MKNVFKATRPAWAVLDSFEIYLTVAATLLIIIFAAIDYELELHTALFSPGGDLLLKALRIIILEALVPFAMVFGILRLYRYLMMGRRYPCTFIYCFYVPKESNPDLARRVVGYMHIVPIRDKGELTADMVSYSWTSYVVGNSRVGYSSTHIYGSEGAREATCHIRFHINKEDEDKRNFRHGLLEFRVIPQPDSANLVDRYVGLMRSTREPFESERAVRCKGYAEKYDGLIGEETEIGVLEEKAPDLFTELNKLLSREAGPSLWTDKNTVPIEFENSFRESIPNPQSVFSHGTVAIHVNNALDNMLRARLSSENVGRFMKDLRRLARQDEEFSSANFEDDVREALTILRPVEQDDTSQLSQRRAEAIHKLITERIKGYTVLDIGCGDGLISKMLKTDRNTIHLLDVLNYKDRSVNLPFRTCTEGIPLPGDEQYETVLLLNVLHHSRHPLSLLDAAWQKASQRMLIIEPVVGIHENPQGLECELARLGDREQVAYATFVDWFYNRVLHKGIPVPLNFTTAEKWRSTFLAKSMPIKEEIYICEEIELEPLLHILFVLDRDTASPANPAAGLAG